MTRALVKRRAKSLRKGPRKSHARMIRYVTPGSFIDAYHGFILYLTVSDSWLFDFVVPLFKKRMTLQYWSRSSNAFFCINLRLVD